MVIEELLVKLGFFADLKGVENFSAQVVGLKKQLGKLVGGIAAVNAAVTGFFSHVLIGIDEQARFAQQVGLTVEQLQQLSYAANMSGGSTEDLESSIRALNKSIFDASEGVGGAVEVFGRLGVATMTADGHLRNTVDVFKDLADRLKALPIQEQEEFAGRIGISNSTLLLLQKGKVGIEELTTEASKLGLYNEKDAEKAMEFAESFRSLSQIFTVLKNQLAINLSPLFVRIVKEFTDWLTVNRQFIEQDITAFIKLAIIVIGALLKVVGLLIDGFNMLIQILGGFHNALQIIAFSAGFYAFIKLPLLLAKVAKAFDAARIAAMLFDAFGLAPVAAAILAVVAAGYLFNDVVTYFEGGDSVLGDIIKKLSTIKKLFQEIGHLFATKPEYLGNIGSNSGLSKVSGGAVVAAIPASNLTAQVPLTTSTKTAINNSTVTNNNPYSEVNTVRPTYNFNVNVKGGQSAQDTADAVKQGLYDAARQAFRNNTSPVKL